MPCYIESEVEIRMNRPWNHVRYTSLGIQDFMAGMQKIFYAGTWRGWDYSQYNLVLTLGGSCVVSDEGGRTTLARGTLAVFRKSSNRHFSVETKWYALFFHINTSVLPGETPAKTAASGPALLLKLMGADFRKCRKLLQEALDTALEQHYGWLPIAKNLVEYVIMYCDRKRNAMTARSTMYDAALSRARAEIGENIRPDNDGLARKCGLSRTSFYHRFKLNTGMTPGKYREMQKISKVMGLLAQDKTLEEIAEATGFPNAYYLSRRFKKIIGVSPKAFRKTNIRG